MVKAKTGTKHRVPARGRRPRKSHPRIDVSIIRLPEAGSYSAKTLWSAGCEIEGIRAPLYFMKEIKEGIAQPEIDSQVRPPFEFVLNVAVKLRLAQAIDRQSSIEAGSAHFI